MLFVFSLILGAVCAGLDQLFKYLVVANIAPGETVTVIPGLLDFVYVKNEGAAFGVLQGAQWLLIAVTFVALAAFAWIVARSKLQNKLLYWACGLILGGGVGNLIDRIVYRYVVDYISVSFFPPICNFADYCITAGVIVLLVYLFFGKDSPLRSKTPQEHSEKHGEDSSAHEDDTSSQPETRS